MLDTLPWMLEAKTKKSAEGIFSRRAAVNAEGKIRNIGIAEWWRDGKEGSWILDTECRKNRKVEYRRQETEDRRMAKGWIDGMVEGCVKACKRR